MTDSVFDEMKEVLALQKKAHIDEGPASYELRLDRLNRLSQMLKKYSDEIVDTISEDYGTRDKNSTFLSEVMSSLGSVDYSIKNLKKWMKSETRQSNSSQPFVARLMMRLLGAKTEIQYQPLGTIGMIKPWNFPINQVGKKIAAAFAAGCTAIVKGPEETPASVAELVKAFDEAGMPKGSLNLVFGIPAEISEYLIPHPIIRKVTFTGSTAVGKQLAALAGAHMKRVTMELGGHSPAIVCEDADVDVAVKILSANKFRNAGQVCISPTRFLVHDSVYNKFVDGFVKKAEELNVGNGLEDGVKMGPLAHDRRLTAIEGFVSDAVEKGAKILTGGKRKGNKGYFFEPTVMTNVSQDARIMNEEPFGPLAPISSFSKMEEVIQEANRLDYGLAAYAYTNSNKKAQELGAGIESGQVSINHHGLGLVDTPFGGVKDSGYGSEGGPEGLEAYMTTKLVSQTGL